LTQANLKVYNVSQLDTQLVYIPVHLICVPQNTTINQKYITKHIGLR